MTRTARGRRGDDGATTRARTNKRPTENETPAKEERSARRSSRVWRSFLHDRSVRSRLAGLIILPLVTTVVFGGLFFKNSFDESVAAARVEDLANIGSTASTLLHRVQDERDVTALVDAGATGAGALSDARNATDSARADLDSALEGLRDDSDALVAATLANYDREINRLPQYRDVTDQKIETFEGAAARTYHRVSTAVQDVIVLSGAVVEDPELSGLIEAQGDIAELSESVSTERALFSLYISPGVVADDDTQERAAVLKAEQNLLMGRFENALPPDQARDYNNDITSASRAASSIGSAIDDQFTVQATKDEWYQAATTRLDAIRAVEGEIGQQVIDDASATASAARNTAIASAVGVVAVLALTVALAVYVARSIVGPLRRLRAAAHDTATVNLPSLVDRIRQDGPAAARQAEPAVTPEGRDEIGQVAVAFNDVHSTAIDVAAAQALLRQNLDTIVVNLSRRTQSLIDRQLGEIEQLEARERDPDQLSTLFRIDHMATRVRRHAESLMVLSGVPEMRQQRTAAPVLDVVRTAVGEVEQYPRVRFGVMPSDLIGPAAADDVAHLLAELIDNATEFSAPSTPVEVTSQPLLGGGLRLEVTDSGLGIPADQMDELNARLINPGDIDVAASRTLGLYVVARLAARHGIRVRLEPGTSGGTVAQIDLPSHLIFSPLDTTEGAFPAITPETKVPQRPAAAPVSGRPLLDATDPAIPAQAGSLPVRSPGQVPPDRPPVQPAQPSYPAAPAATPFTPRPAQPTPPPAQPEPTPREPERPAQPAYQQQRQPAQRPEPSYPPAAERRQVEPPRTPSRPEPRRPAAASAPPPAAPAPPTTSWERPSHGERPHTRPGGYDQRPAAQTRPLAADLGRRDYSRPTSLRAPEPPRSEGDSPIYESIRSAWFSKDGGSRDWSSPADDGWRRAAEALRSAEEAASARRVQQRDPAPTPSRQVPAPAPSRRVSPPARPAAAPPPPRRQPAPAASWTTGGEAGPAAEEPIFSPSGLPVRRRGASLVPGSIGDPGNGTSSAPQPAPARAQDAGNVASTLSSLQRGVSRGREESGGWVPNRPSDPEGSNS